MSHRLVLYSVKLGCGFMLGQGAIAPAKGEPCPQMFWLQQQYAVALIPGAFFGLQNTPVLPRTPSWRFALRTFLRLTSHAKVWRSPLGTFSTSISGVGGIAPSSQIFSFRTAPGETAMLHCQTPLTQSVCYILHHSCKAKSD